MELINKVLIPITDPAYAAPYLKLAAALLPPEGKILALSVVRIPEETSLSEGTEEARSYRAVLEELKSHLWDDRVQRGERIFIFWWNSRILPAICT